MMIPTKYLWEHLYSMWDIDILDSAQESPFPENKVSFSDPPSLLFRSPDLW